LGSHERKQLALDLGGPVGDRDDVSYRVIGVVRDGKTAFDHVEERKHYFAPSLTLRPSDTTTLTLLAEYQKIDSPGGDLCTRPSAQRHAQDRQSPPPPSKRLRRRAGL
ncbi:hypothetical protein RZS08_13575, partial [Arthrospira platensis SPKY1]|nr:hypothetical protein [Arthrospira platensis SPKY1]